MLRPQRTLRRSRAARALTTPCGLKLAPKRGRKPVVRLPNPILKRLRRPSPSPMRRLLPMLRPATLRPNRTLKQLRRPNPNLRRALNRIRRKSRKEVSRSVNFSARAHLLGQGTFPLPFSFAPNSRTFAPHSGLSAPPDECSATAHKKPPPAKLFMKRKNKFCQVGFVLRYKLNGIERVPCPSFRQPCRIR